MGAEVHAFGRRAKVSDYPDTEYVSKYFTKDTLPAFLSNCDYIVNVLPTTPETAGLLNGNVLENCKGCCKSFFIPHNFIFNSQISKLCS